MKDNPITVGLDDARFRFEDPSKKTTLIAVVCQGTRMVRVLKEKITIDGNDSTQIIVRLVKQVEKHVQYILMDTITFGGFNISDLDVIYQETGKPIITVSEKEVDLDAVKRALLLKFPDTFAKKLRLIQNAGNLYDIAVKTAGGWSTVHVHLKGVDIEEARELLQKISVDAKLPECIRMAHIIGKAF